MHPAGFGSLFQGFAADGDDVCRAVGDDVGAAHMAAPADDGHFTEAFAAGQRREPGAVLADRHRAVGDETEEVARFAIAHDCRARGDTFPSRETKRLPDFDIGEVGEEGQGAQRGELLGVDKFFSAGCLQLAVAHRLGEVVGKGLPGRIAVIEIPGHRAADDFVEDRRQAGPLCRGRDGVPLTIW